MGMRHPDLYIFWAMDYVVFVTMENDYVAHRNRTAGCACCALSTQAMRCQGCPWGHSLAVAGERSGHCGAICLSNRRGACCLHAGHIPAPMVYNHVFLNFMPMTYLLPVMIP